MTDKTTDRECPWKLSCSNYGFINPVTFFEEFLRRERFLVVTNTDWTITDGLVGVFTIVSEVWETKLQVYFLYSQDFAFGASHLASHD